MSGIRCIEPWEEIEEKKRGYFEAQLKREVRPGHALYQIEAVAVAQKCDDVLFRLINHVPAFAVVHLTYGTSTSPQWPITQNFESLEDWDKNCMKPDHEDWK